MHKFLSLVDMQSQVKSKKIIMLLQSISTPQIVFWYLYLLGVFILLPEVLWLDICISVIVAIGALQSLFSVRVLGIDFPFQISQRCSILKKADVAMKNGQVQQEWHNHASNNEQSQACPLISIAQRDEYPQTLCEFQQQKENQADYQSEEIHVIFFADAIIYVFAVMVKFLNAAVASFAMIAVLVHIDLASFTPNQQLFISWMLLKELILKARVNWIYPNQSHIVIAYEQKQNVTQSCEGDKNGICDD